MERVDDGRADPGSQKGLLSHTYRRLGASYIDHIVSDLDSEAAHFSDSPTLRIKVRSIASVMAA